MAGWMEPFARTIDAAKKYVVSGTLTEVDWNAELVRGDWETTVRRLKQQPGKGLLLGGEAPAGAGRTGIDRRVQVHRAIEARGPRADIVRRTSEEGRFEARGSAGIPLGCGIDAVRAVIQR
jgi:hypothetical protein